MKAVCRKQIVRGKRLKLKYNYFYFPVCTFLPVIHITTTVPVINHAAMFIMSNIAVGPWVSNIFPEVFKYVQSPRLPAKTTTVNIIPDTSICVLPNDTPIPYKGETRNPSKNVPIQNKLTVPEAKYLRNVTDPRWVTAISAMIVFTCKNREIMETHKRPSVKLTQNKVFKYEA